MLIGIPIKVTEPLQDERAYEWKTNRSLSQHDPPSNLGPGEGLATSSATSRNREECGSIPMDVDARSSNQPSSSRGPSRGYPHSRYSSSSYGTQFISAFDSDCLHQRHEISEMRSPSVPLSSPTSPISSNIAPQPCEASEEKRNL